MKLETIRNRPYYLKTGPSELAEFRLEYVDKFRDEYGYVHVFKFKDINCRKFVVKPTFSVSLSYSMKMLLEVDNRPVRKEEICIDNHNELYLMIYLQNWLSDVDKQTLKNVYDEINIKHIDYIENILEEDLKEKYFNRYFNEPEEPETQPDKSDLKIVEKPEIKIKENEAKGGSNMEIKLDVNAMIQIKALDKILGDGKITNGKLMKMSMVIESTGGKLTELAKTKIMAKFFSEKTEDMDVEKLMLFKQLNEGRFDPAEIMQYRMMSSVYDSLGDALDDEVAEPKK